MNAWTPDPELWGKSISLMTGSCRFSRGRHKSLSYSSWHLCKISGCWFSTHAQMTPNAKELCVSRQQMEPLRLGFNSVDYVVSRRKWKTSLWAGFIVRVHELLNWLVFGTYTSIAPCVQIKVTEDKSIYLFWNDTACLRQTKTRAQGSCESATPVIPCQDILSS